MARLTTPSEAVEMRALKQWADLHPICKDYLFHISNEGKRSPRTGANLVKQGLRKGVSDFFLAYPVNGWHGLFLEMKRSDGKGRLTKEQKEWLERVYVVGYQACSASGWERARFLILQYLDGAPLF